MAENFDENKTVKITGVSQLLRDQITKEFQRKNSTGYKEDVSKLYVCPNGKDHVLVEFSKGIEDKRALGDTLEIDGTKLKVEQWVRQTESKGDAIFESVSKIWPTDKAAITVPQKTQQTVQHHGETPTNNTEQKNRRGKQARKDKIDRGRPGLNREPETTLGPPVPFRDATVSLNKDFANRIKEGKCKEILKKQDITVDNKGRLKGTWNAIYAGGRYLASYFSGSGETENDASYSSEASFSADDKSITQPAGLDQSANSYQGIGPFNVNSLFFRYILVYHYDVFQNLENVSKEIRLEMLSDSEKKLTAIPRTSVDNATFLKTVDEFIDFYQKQNPKMHQEVTPVQPQDVISEACSLFSVVIDSSQLPGKMMIYGEKDKVKSAKSFVEGKVGSSNTGNGCSNVPNKDTKAKGTLHEKLSYKLSMNVELIVYQGDLTQEKVDAIVNPANDRLQHGGGAAGAIVKAGGRSIQDESDKIMWDRRRTPFKPGNVAITGSGNLPCNFVVHTVGPVWNYYPSNTAKQLLYSAVHNSLMCACSNRATSISIPAISSGLYKAPANVCAQVLFNAVIDFIKVSDSSMPLKEIRFVNIDSSTNRTFVREMEQRFGDSVRRERIDAVPLKDNKKQNKSTKNAQHTQVDFSKSNHQGHGSRQGSASRQSTNVTNKRGQSHPSGDHESKGSETPSPQHVQPAKTPRSYSDAAAAGKTTVDETKL